MGAEGDDQTTANHPEGRIALNAAYADIATKLNTDAGDASTPVYFKDGVPVVCEDVKAGDYLPLTAGEDFKLTGPLGLTENAMYGLEFPENPFEGQLFFLEDASAGALPTGGVAGQALVKNSDANGDASWKDIVALPKGGNSNTILIKNSEKDGDAVWSDNIMYVSDQGISMGVPVSADSGIWSDGDINTTCSITAADDITATNFIADSVYVETLLDAGNATAYFYEVGGAHAMFDNSITCLGSITGKKVYGAVWNDYAEYRNQKEMIKPGYCVASADNGQVYKTTEKFQACDGIVSDTFGFAIGETNECKTPLAVAGRVLAYCEGNRYDYHAGDTVCAGPDGKIVKMSREEIREWPDRIVGIVSEIPEYETWGSGDVLVDGRIWIKVK